MARNIGTWLPGEEAPKHRDEETCIVALETRIANSVAYLKTFKENDFAPWNSEKTHPGEVFLQLRQVFSEFPAAQQGVQENADGGSVVLRGGGDRTQGAERRRAENRGVQADR